MPFGYARDLFHKGHQVVLRAPIAAAAQHAARMHVQRRDQRLRAVAEVLELAPACAPGARRAVRVLALDGLDAGLLVDAQHHRVLGRGAVQLADRVDLLAKLRLRAVQPLPHAVRAHIAGLQDALQVAAADVLDHALLDGALAQLVQRRCGPALCFARFARQGQQLQPLRATDAPRPPGALHFPQPRHALAGNAAAPLRHAGQRHPQ